MKTEPNHDTEPVPPPSACPACRSSAVKTTSKTVTRETYWRCEACGEVWNVARRKVSRYTTSGSFRS